MLLLSKEGHHVWSIRIFPHDSANFREIERRLRAMEKHLNVLVSERPRVPWRPPSHVGETVNAVLSGVADRFRGGANSMGDEAAKIGSKRRRSLATMPCAASRRKSSTAHLSRSQSQSAWEFLWGWSVTAVDGPSGCQRITSENNISHTKRGTPMNKDEVIGTAKNLGGKAQEAFGNVAGDTKSQVEGVINQAAGAAQISMVTLKRRPQMPPKRSATARWMLRIMSAIRSKNVLTQRRS